MENHADTTDEEIAAFIEEKIEDEKSENHDKYNAILLKKDLKNLEIYGIEIINKTKKYNIILL